MSTHTNKKNISTNPTDLVANGSDKSDKSDELAMYIILNNDLHMGKGKLVSQGSHVVSKITRNLEKMCNDKPKSDQVTKYKKWLKNGEAKIVLKATTLQLEELLKLPESEYIIDAGRTQIAENSLTAVGFYPNTKTTMGKILGNYSLL